MERLGDFGRDRNAAARQRQHHRVLILVCGERRGKPPTRLGSVLERHGGSALRFIDAPPPARPAGAGVRRE